jgi:hypothetical protein
MKNRLHHLPLKKSGSVCWKLHVRMAAIVAGNLSDSHPQNSEFSEFDFVFESLHGTSTTMPDVTSCNC